MAAASSSYAETIVNDIFDVLAKKYYDPEDKFVHWKDVDDKEREHIIEFLLQKIKDEKDILKSEQKYVMHYQHLINFLNEMKQVAANRVLFQEFDRSGLYGLHKLIIFFIFPFEKELIENFDGYDDVIRVQKINNTIRTYNDMNIIPPEYKIVVEYARPFLHIARDITDKLIDELKPKQQYNVAVDPYGDKRRGGRTHRKRTHRKRAHKRTHRKRKH